ncbi:MAG: integrase domain-containing protein [Colwellia sp.]|nr:integrase domain-containing protein [Colwellia sp.]MCW8863449.1 integrase domain-containing protein [Colwellia sp.]MCW9081411.1 integrase domain-containing protein [Colwellia sp.]
MAKITKPLTNTEVKAAKVKDKEYNLADGAGLQLRVKPNGSKLWLFNYQRPFTKKRANLSLGKYPNLSLAGARKESANARELLGKNIDPKAHRDKQAQAKKNAIENTFIKYAEDWKALKETKWKEPTIRRAYQSLNKHVIPTLKDCPIDQVKPKHLKEIMKPIVAEGKHETVKRLCTFVNDIMKLAVADGSIEFNPLKDVTTLFPVPVRNHFKTLKPDQLPKLMLGMATANISRVTRCMFLLQLNCATRAVETATAEWSEVNLAEKIWTIPASKMKSNREHCIPLSTQVIELFEYMQPISSHRKYVFPSVKNPQSHANRETVNTALKRNGFKDIIVSHGFRALFSTTCNEQGFDYDVVEAALAHLDPNLTRRSYNRTDYLEKRRELMQWWSDHIQKASQGDMSMISSFKNLRVVGE